MSRSLASLRTSILPILASARIWAEALEIVAPDSIRTSPVAGSTTSPQAIRPSSFAAASLAPVSIVSAS